MYRTGVTLEDSDVLSAVTYDGTLYICNIDDHLMFFVDLLDQKFDKLAVVFKFQFYPFFKSRGVRQEISSNSEAVLDDLLFRFI